MADCSDTNKTVNDHADCVTLYGTEDVVLGSVPTNARLSHAEPEACVLEAGGPEEGEPTRTACAGCPCSAANGGCSGCWHRWRGAARLALFNIISGIPSIMLMAIMPEVKKAYFGSDQKAALATVLFAATVTAINIFTVAPFARLTDAIGRRPLFMLAAVLSVVQFALPVAFPTNPVPYMFLQSVSGLIQSSYAWAMVADVTAEEHRQWAFTIVAGISMSSMIFALPVGVIDASNETFFIISAALASLSPVYVYFCVPETLEKEKRVPLTRAAVCVNPFKELYTLAHSRALVIVIAVMTISTGIDSGLKDVYLFVLNDRIGFTKSDNGIFFPCMAISAMFGFFVIMPFVKDRIRPTSIITASLLSTMGLMLAVALAWAPYVMYGAAVLYGPLILAQPVTQALAANTGPAELTTARLTALIALADVGSTVGPLVFGGLYDILPDRLNQLPFFAFAGVCLALAAVVYLLLPRALKAEEAKAAAASASDDAPNDAPADGLGETLV